MPKTAFISIVHEDKKDVIHTIENWRKQDFITAIEFNYEEKDLRQLGDDVVKKYLKELLDKSQVVVFIIGKDTLSHNWIGWEYSYAQNSGKRLVYLYLENHNYKLPAIFPQVTKEKFNLANFKKLVGC